MRNKILELIKERNITKVQMSRDLDITEQHLGNIIKCKSEGSKKFWRNFQKAYNINEDEIELYKQKG